MKNLLTSILLIGLFFSCTAQKNLPPGTYTITNKKAIKKYEAAKKYMDAFKYKETEEELNNALKLEPNFVEAYTLLAVMFIEKRENQKATEALQKAVDLNANFFPNNVYQLGELYFYTGKYEEAKKYLTQYTNFERVNPTIKENAQRLLLSCNFAIDAIKNPKPFKPQNIGPAINSNHYEYFPTITADGTTFLFTRNFRGDDGKNGSQEDFYISQKQNGVWQASKPITSINSPANEGAPTISADGQFMFFVLCPDQYGNYGKDNRKGFGSCDIFYSKKNNGIWSDPINVGPPVNTGNWETQPSFSSDGKTLYFVRGIQYKDGRRMQDIFMTQIGENGAFGEPVKLNNNVNSDRKEESVYIHPDNMTLYFSSDGFPGMGGLDLFMSKRQANGDWGPAINLGYPINTYTDENSLLVDPSGKLAYFASSREGGIGGLDIYYFELPEEYRPENITYIKGKVYDSLTIKPLEAAFELFDLETQQKVLSSYSGKDGNFLVTLNEGKNYLLNVSKDGYLYFSDNFSLKDVKADFNHPYTLTVPLQPIDTGMSVVLKNVFFDVDQFVLKPESKAELEKLITFLKKNPKLKIELSGHTDNTGDKKKNQILSQNRAKAVYDYVITNGGIDKSRLTFKGYGDAKPRVANDTPEHKAMNRRTEFKVIGK